MVGGRCVHVSYTLGAYRRMYIGCLPIVVCGDARVYVFDSVRDAEPGEVCHHEIASTISVSNGQARGSVSLVM